MKMIALATAVAGVACSAAADIQLTIDPTGSNTATITGSGMLDENLFDVIIIRLYSPDPLIGADDGVGDSIFGSLALGASALDVISTQGGGQLQFRFDQPTNFLAGDAITGVSTLSFDSETFAPVGTVGLVEVLFSGAPRGPGGFSAVIGNFTIVPSPASLTLLSLGGVAAMRRRR